MNDARELYPLTVHELRRFLSENDVPDYVQVVVGGADFDDHNKKLIGVADDIWLDGDGPVGGRLVIGAMGIGLVDG